MPFPLIAAGEQHVDSSVAAIVIATVPLLIALLALRFDHTERPTRTRMLGMLIGLAGVVALVGIDLSGESGELLGAGAVMIAAVGYAAGPMIIKRHLLDYDPRATMAASLTVAAVLLTPAGLLTIPGSVPPADAHQLPDRARRGLHGGSLRDPDGPGLRGGRGPRLDHHLHQPGHRRGAGRDRPRGEPRRGGDRRACCSSWRVRGSPPTIACRPNPTAIVTRWRAGARATGDRALRAGSGCVTAPPGVAGAAVILL